MVTALSAIALRLNAYGWNVPKITQYLDWAEQTVRETISRWHKDGLGGLWKTLGRGRTRRWNEADWQALE